MLESVGRVQGQSVEMWPGRPYPLGATFDGTGVNFALFSEVASKVELCFIDDGRRGDARRAHRGRRQCLARVHPTDPARSAIRLSGLRSVRPANGHRCNPSKFLLDPYAKAISGQIDGDESLFSYRFADPTAFNDLDSRGHTMLSVVTTPYFDWGMIDHHDTSTTRASFTRCT